MIDYEVSNCPVPTEQQPLNEYEQLKNSWLFQDCSLSTRSYLTKILWIWGLSWLVAGPVAYSSFPPHKYIIHFLLCGSAGASIGVVLVLLRLYLGWSYVRDRLASPIIFYEESGWYDGQNWMKPQQVLDRDLLVVSYEIKPIIQRLQITALCLVMLFFAGTIVWHSL
ncbi:CGLD27 family protein [Plectonema cf. radiosum LEGE 06105]|uniref:CGLD27 family protein n=1 Tax=Plectonema cf. radiosum LEGE 06105 TaxID=945769 RepID=A0A8J7FBC6_9CYAN|nr:CGLD27 family protein [Plectonema radiosum]MBE9215164.1 CGLD27 family protein [Plectonema cf. radiosum LEGE 06105]